VSSPAGRFLPRVVAGLLARDAWKEPLVFYDGWRDLVRILVLGIAGYAAVLLLLRASGKRTLSKLNAFDFVVTVALGSTLATVLLSDSVSLVDGVTALALLVALQYAVAWASVRSKAIERLVKSEPTLLYHHGFLSSAMRRERVTADELREAARKKGHARLDHVVAVVLETDGTLSVLSDDPGLLRSGEEQADGADQDQPR
jgi:uncharacterized membrane protein YcaP (DUF421 family)